MYCIMVAFLEWMISFQWHNMHMIKLNHVTQLCVRVQSICMYTMYSLLLKVGLICAIDKCLTKQKLRGKKKSVVYSFNILVSGDWWAHIHKILYMNEWIIKKNSHTENNVSYCSIIIQWRIVNGHIVSSTAIHSNPNISSFIIHHSSYYIFGSYITVFERLHINLKAQQ